jgi:aminoglycoside phosphotransferase (APT) family kinase protein
MISDNGVSKVWREGDYVFKSQPKFMTDNEIWCLKTMYESGGVPLAEKVDIELIRMEYIPEELDKIGIRHGDLTRPNMIFNGNDLYVLDWAESRLSCDPREDKRPKGDEWWMRETIRETFQRSL